MNHNDDIQDISDRAKDLKSSFYENPPPLGTNHNEISKPRGLSLVISDPDVDVDIQMNNKNTDQAKPMMDHSINQSKAKYMGESRPHYGKIGKAEAERRATILGGNFI